MKNIRMLLTFKRFFILALMIAGTFLVMHLLPTGLFGADEEVLVIFLVEIVIWFAFFYAKDSKQATKSPE